MYIYIYTCISVCMYIYIYIYIYNVGALVRRRPQGPQSSTFYHITSHCITLHILYTLYMYYYY